MIRWIFLLFLVPILLLQEDKPVNLVANGDFEKGGKHPANWQKPDGLSSFWVDDPKREGKSMKFDTDVLVQEFRKRSDQMKAKAPPPARLKTPPGKRIYDTVAAHDGVGFLSDPMVVEKGVRYRLSVDARAENGKKECKPKVFVLGYFQHKGKERRGYMVYKSVKTQKEWKTYTLDFDPTGRSPAVTHIRVKLFPYWPPAIYYFDNVRIEKLPAKEEEGE